MNKFVVPLLFVAVAFTGCKGPVALHTPQTIPIKGQRLTALQIVEAIKLGASSQGWEVTEEGPGYVLVSNIPDSSASYGKSIGLGGNRHQKYSTIRVGYDRGSVNFQYVSSENLRYEYVTRDKQAVDRVYNSVIKGLAQAIDYQIKLRTNV